jgi:hypothetical protein
MPEGLVSLEERKKECWKAVIEAQTITRRVCVLPCRDLALLAVGRQDAAQPVWTGGDGASYQLSYMDSTAVNTRSCGFADFTSGEGLGDSQEHFQGDEAGLLAGSDLRLHERVGLLLSPLPSSFLLCVPTWTTYKMRPRSSCHAEVLMACRTVIKAQKAPKRCVQLPRAMHGCGSWGSLGLKNVMHSSCQCVWVWFVNAKCASKSMCIATDHVLCRALASVVTAPVQKGMLLACTGCCDCAVYQYSVGVLEQPCIPGRTHICPDRLELIGAELQTRVVTMITKRYIPSAARLLGTCLVSVVTRIDATISIRDMRHSHSVQAHPGDGEGKCCMPVQHGTCGHCLCQTAQHVSGALLITPAVSRMLSIPPRTCSHLSSSSLLRCTCWV